MTDRVYTVQTQSYVKLMLHAAKRPANSMCGLLLGQKKGQGVEIMDAMPLFHHEAPLAPLLEVACAMVEAFCQSDQKLTIVGFYYAENGHSSSESGTGLSHFAEKVADRVEHQFSHACVLLVDNNEFGNETKGGLQFLLKDVKRGWSKAEDRFQVAQGAAEVLTQGLQQDAQDHLVDFEEHLEDPSKDWRNPHVVELLKLNV
uniref:MPN domain-containing protein n=1 Tax=Hyaloperonospora arabidopsidis (strain Emoy2) TaxID=559515 RepID=M4BIS6_HYAAE